MFVRTSRPAERKKNKSFKANNLVGEEEEVCVSIFEEIEPIKYKRRVLGIHLYSDQKREREKEYRNPQQ